MVGASAYTDLPESGHDPQKFLYMVEVYVDDFMSFGYTSVKGAVTSRHQRNNARYT